MLAQNHPNPSCGNNGWWVGAPLSRLQMCAIFSGVAFQPEILGNRLYLFVYLFIYLLLASPCVLLYYMEGHENLYGQCVCVCVFFSLAFFLLLIDLSWCCSWEVFILVYYFGGKNYKHSPNIWSHQKMVKLSFKMEHFVSFINKFRYLSMSKLPFLSIKDVCLFVCLSCWDLPTHISPYTPSLSISTPCCWKAPNEQGCNSVVL
jgi:hypothetical protein